MSINNGNVAVTGTITANGTLLTSDMRYKRNVTTLPHSLQQLVRLRGTAYYFNQQLYPAMNFSPGKQMGLIAQEVEKVFPELVSTDQDGYKSINYIGLIPVMLESIKEQQKQIDELRKLVQSLLKKTVH
ncbi:MAG: tail fiber domain-containing protein [Chitinophagaceae bacterium]